MRLLYSLFLATSVFSSTEFCTDIKTSNSHIKFSFEGMDYVLPTSKLEAYKEPQGDKDKKYYYYYLFFEEEGCVISQYDYEALVRQLGL